MNGFWTSIYFCCDARDGMMECRGRGGVGKVGVIYGGVYRGLSGVSLCMMEGLRPRGSLVEPLGSLGGPGGAAIV